MLSHELRNPLAPIRNAVEILEMSDVSDPTVVWSRDVIGRQVTQLARLVDDLLDVSRITSGKIALVQSSLDMRTVVDHAVESCRAQMETRKHRVTVAVPDHALCVNGDSARLVQVLTNLLSNAAKYTPDGGLISLTLEQHGRDAVVRVSDDGVGMHADLLMRVFELFAQGERTLARSEGGLGVGLTLVRRLIEMHGGSVSAVSEGPGLGSTFELRLPITATTAHTDERNLAAHAFANAGRAHRILVVDDNADSSASMAALLSMRGHEVLTALDGASALLALNDFAAELVLLDIGLPGLTGYDVAREIRRRHTSGEMVLCAMTGYGQDDDRRRTHDAGFDHHLTKPVSMSALYEIIGGLTSIAAV
jgi:CheY-like chemotaxis protein